MLSHFSSTGPLVTVAVESPNGSSELSSRSTVSGEFNFGASTSFGAPAGAVGSTDCGAAAAKRSSNESNGGTLAGAEITGAGSGKAATMVSAAEGALLTAKAGRLITGASKLALLSCG